MKIENGMMNNPKSEMQNIENWHKTILQEREKLIKNGKAKYIDWESAKISIKEEINNLKELNKS